MEIKVGIQNVAREVVLQTTVSADEIEKDLVKALADGGVLRLVSESGGSVLVPASAIAYIDLGQEHARQVGFGSMG